MEDNRSLEDYISSINNSIDTIRSNKDKITKDDIPSDFKLMMTGAKNSKALNFIFDNRLDKFIDILLNKLTIGNYDELDQYMEVIKKIFETIGIGEGSFEGPVSQLIMNNITRSLNSIDFNVTKIKIKKIMIIIKNLKAQAATINNKDTKEKYNEAVKALKKVLKIIAKIYKNRRIITNKMASISKGLNYAIHENVEADESLEGF